MKLSQLLTAKAAIAAGKYYRTQGMTITDKDIVDIVLEQTENGITRKEAEDLVKEYAGEKDDKS